MSDHDVYLMDQMMESTQFELLGSLTDLERKGLVRHQNHPTLPLSIWNYTEKCQFEDSWNPLLLDCRGLVIDNNTGEIVAKPFPKFFNYEQQKHIPTDDYCVYGKVDGSLGIVFSYKNQTIVATRGSFTSDQAIKAKEILDTYNIEIKPGITILAEIIYPENRIVCKYNEEKLVLLGAYVKVDDDFIEVPIEELDWPHKVECYGKADFLVLQAKDIDGEEGYVIRYSNGQRCKVKFATYCKLHRVMTQISSTAIWEILSEGKNLDELLEGVPDEFFDKIKEYAQKLEMQKDGWYQIAYGYYCGMKDIESRKEFAEKAKETQVSDVLFKMRDNRPYEHLLWNRVKPEFVKL
jgi:hypothetical protein